MASEKQDSPVSTYESSAIFICSGVPRSSMSYILRIFDMNGIVPAVRRDISFANIMSVTMSQGVPPYSSGTPRNPKPASTKALLTSVGT